MLCFEFMLWLDSTENDNINFMVKLNYRKLKHFNDKILSNFNFEKYYNERTETLQLFTTELKRSKYSYDE